MKYNKVTYTLIKAAVKKGISDIQENPRRGIRNMVDLGRQFSTGHIQLGFFDSAQAELLREDSNYYKLVERAVRGTDAAIMSALGMNLGYNAWTYGAAKIRDIEEREGFNVPWCLVFDMQGGEPLDTETIDSTIRQAMELGIYCHMFCLKADYPWLDELMKIFEREKDGVFVLLLPAEKLTQEFAERVKAVKTVWPVIELDGAPELAEQAVEALKKGGTFLAGSIRSSFSSEQADAVMDRADALGLSFVLFINEEKGRPNDLDGDFDTVNNYRKALKYPLLPIELYADIAHIDRNISSEACLTIIMGSGEVITQNAETKETHGVQSIKTQSLKEILKSTMPKKEDAS